MALSSYTSYQTASDSPWRYIDDTKNAVTTVAGRLYSGWVLAPNTGAAPTTAAVPTNTTTGAMGQSNGGTNQRLCESILSTQAIGTVLIVDRLSHQGGLSATTTGAQTTNLPTAALTRYTSGVGVMLALEIYSAVGTTGTTVTASYTDSALGAGTSTLAVTFGGTGFREANRAILLPLAVGGTGVTAVANVNLVASTLTAGNFGVTLFYPIAVCPSPVPAVAKSNEFLWTSGFIPPVPDNSCLQYMFLCNTTSTGVLMTSHVFIES